MTESDPDFTPIGKRFRGYLPVVVDVETGGFNPKTDALLQIGVALLRMTAKGELYRFRTLSYHLDPFAGARLDPKSLAVNRINPHHPLRISVPEPQGLAEVFKEIRAEIKDNACTRAILVGHNAHFDLQFINAAAERNGIKRNPFHQFSNFDTVTLSAMAFGQTVLARSVKAAGLSWENEEAHSALYDAEKTADLFCTVINRWQAYAALAGASFPDS